MTGVEETTIFERAVISTRVQRLLRNSKYFNASLKEASLKIGADADAGTTATAELYI